MKVKVWLSGNYGKEESNYFFSNNNMSPYGYSHIGEAEIAVTLFPEADVTASRISSLNSQIEKIKAEAGKQIDALQVQISKLQALTYEAN